MTASDRSTMSVMLTSTNTKVLTRFYIEKLGFEMKESWPTADDPLWANMVLAGQSVMIGAAPDPDNLESMCQGDATTLAYWKKAAEDFKSNKPGVGIQVYLMVDDVDTYYADVLKRGLKPETEPKTQFYGIRDFGVNDPDGYHLVFFSPVTMSTCQSCGMPLQDAEPGQMYCAYCTNDKGELKPYEQVFEGTVKGYFMDMQKMPRQEAETAATDMLKKLPAWAGHGSGS